MKGGDKNGIILFNLRDEAGEGLGFQRSDFRIDHFSAAHVIGVEIQSSLIVELIGATLVAATDCQKRRAFDSPHHFGRLLGQFNEVVETEFEDVRGNGITRGEELEVAGLRDCCDAERFLCK